MADGLADRCDRGHTPDEYHGDLRMGMRWRDTAGRSLVQFGRMVSSRSDDLETAWRKQAVERGDNMA
jgi:hypothetical protein